MLAIKTVLTASLALLPLAASAAELPVPKLHRAHVYRVHARYVQRVHFGYYWGQSGWRWGGSAHSWYGSTFAFGGPPGPAALASSPKGVAAIDCSGPRPNVCLAEPVVVPVALAGPPTWR